MPRLLVGISVNLNPELLQAINDNVNAKTQSERVGLCITEGFKVLKK